MKDKKMICPRCKQNFEGFPALSRRDNKTNICTMCGHVEAFIDAGMMKPDQKEIEFCKSLGINKYDAA